VKINKKLFPQWYSGGEEIPQCSFEEPPGHRGRGVLSLQKYILKDDK